MGLVQGSCRLLGCQIIYAGMTNTGRVRRCNEDDLLMLGEVGVFAVADGLGGLDAGDIASKTALSHLQDLYIRRSGMGIPPLQEIIATVNLRTHQHKIALARNMATTLAMVQLCGSTVGIAHVGDSRVYHWRNTVLSRETRDHSLVNELIQKGALTISQAEHSLQRHIITRAIGAEPTVTPTILYRPVVAGDMLLLCTDGLTSMLSDARIAEIIGDRPGYVGETVEDLVQAANQAGGRDNITVILVAIKG
jgi:protein phosphatase